jgi:pyridoxine kinase
MARVLAISSHVVRGQVGLNASVPALQRLGHEVWALPTLVLSSRPGLGRLVRHELPTTSLVEILAALEADGCWAAIDGVLTGYFPSAESVTAAAAAIARIKSAKPELTILVDPILGDAGRLYVAESTANAMKTQLLPLASIATPNLFELNWLAGRPGREGGSVDEVARTLGVPTVVVTSASETAAGIATHLVAPGHVLRCVSPRRTDIPNGAGDLLAGLLLAHLLHGQAPPIALGACLALLDRVLLASEGKSVLDLAALNMGTP